MSSPTVFFIADTHFNHSKIIKFCDRPFTDSHLMTEQIIDNWNKTVREKDVVYHLGDFGFGEKDEIKTIQKRLHGRIKLIKGNHDTHNNDFYRDCGFEWVYDTPIIYKDFLVLSHEPSPFILSKIHVNVFGHVHNSNMFKQWGEYYSCVSVEKTNYRPVSLDEIKKHFSINQSKETNPWLN